MNNTRFIYYNDNKVFLTEVDIDDENVIFKVIDPIDHEILMIVNDANRYEDFCMSDNKDLFLELSTYRNIVDFYYSKKISECEDLIKDVSK